jgi:hypothetical protein
MSKLKSLVESAWALTGIPPSDRQLIAFSPNLLGLCAEAEALGGEDSLARKVTPSGLMKPIIPDQQASFRTYGQW